MDAIKKCEQLKTELETARETAVELRDGLETVDHMDVTYIDLALETVGLRLIWLKNQAEAAKKSKPEKKDKE